MLNQLKQNVTTSIACLASLLCWLALTSTNPVYAEVKSQTVQQDFSAVVKISFINPDNGQQGNCSGVLIAPSRVATVASCMIAEETFKQVRTARVCSSRTGISNCTPSKTILTHSGYLSAEQVNASNNLAYIDLQQPLQGVEPIPELSPADFESLVAKDTSSLTTFWVGYDNRSIKKRGTVSKNFAQLQGLEYDYVNKRFVMDTAEILPGQHYQGSAILLEHQGKLKLLGLISTTTPDRIVHYYPEVNPCDEDPIIVRYPEPIIRSISQVTAYPVASCGMLGYQTHSGYRDLSCKRMSRRTELDKALQRNDRLAMRQHAEYLIAQADPTQYVIDIYQHLQQAHEAGDPEASLALARLLIEGEVLPEDKQTANTLLAGIDLPEARWLKAQQLLLAYVDQDMRSVNPDLDGELFAHLDVAANAGFADAQYYLGRLYQFGIGTEESNRIAYQWYARAAMQGQSRAQFQLGTMWVDGRGVRSYPQVGEYWIRQAAARGYIKAQNYLAMNRGQQTINDALNEYEFEFSDS
jgi:hypothetical protein